MKVNWDDEIPNIWENKKCQPNHQPAYCYIIFPNDPVDIASDVASAPKLVHSSVDLRSENGDLMELNWAQLI